MILVSKASKKLFNFVVYKQLPLLQLPEAHWPFRVQAAPEESCGTQLVAPLQ